MRNIDNSETISAEMVLEWIEGYLPSSWSLTVERGPTGRDLTPDAILKVQGPDRKSCKIAVEIRKRVDPRDVTPIVDRIRSLAAGVPLVVAPFLSPRTRELLAKAGASFADLTGNLRRAVDRPALFISTQGAAKNPFREKRTLGSLKGPSAGRVVRAFCDFTPPFGVRDLATRSRTSPAAGCPPACA